MVDSRDFPFCRSRFSSRRNSFSANSPAATTSASASATAVCLDTDSPSILEAELEPAASVTHHAIPYYNDQVRQGGAEMLHPVGSFLICVTVCQTR